EATRSVNASRRAVDKKPRNSRASSSPTCTTSADEYRRMSKTRCSTSYTSTLVVQNSVLSIVDLGPSPTSHRLDRFPCETHALESALVPVFGTLHQHVNERNARIPGPFEPHII